ncbi:3-deoxy-7-phosphoheptulonate synthase [Candidatus Vidania fulgoroideorum]
MEPVGFVLKGRKIIKDAINGNINKLIVVLGPCSIHNVKSALTYADMLNSVKGFYKNLILVMRVYLEKPRTISGWKGFLYDPFLDFSFKLNIGIRKSLLILKSITKKKVLIATEFLNNLACNYIKNYISIGSIGARNCESQIHREMASFLRLPIGFKNNLDCDIRGSINSILSCKTNTFSFFIGQNSRVFLSKKNSNFDCFLILRGGNNSINYDPNSVNFALKELNNAGIFNGLFIDFSHGNSCKVFTNQIKVSLEVCKQIEVNNNIVGVMIESHINNGSQKFSSDADPSISVTDPCISFNETISILDSLNRSIQLRKPIKII